MKITKVHDGKLERARYFFIETDDGLMYFQRIDLFSAMDKPISYDEEIIIALCERIKELQGESCTK